MSYFVFSDKFETFGYGGMGIESILGLGFKLKESGPPASGP